LENRPIAAKTGTTNGYRDAWTIGYTPSLVAGVWVGNNDNTEMKSGAGGSTVAAPIWNYFMKKVLGDTPAEEFKKPEIKKTNIEIIDGTIDFLQKIKIDTISGLLATENTPKSLIKEENFFNYHSILYYINKENPLKEKSAANEDPQFENWEKGIVSWIERKNKKIEEGDEDYKDLEKILLPPTKEDNVHTPENIPELKITKPRKNEKITNRILSVNITYSSKQTINRAEYYINNNLIFINQTPPFNLNKNIGFLKGGTYKLGVILCDEVENCIKKETTFVYNGPEIDYNTENTKIILNSSISGVALNKIDFPLTINANINNYQQIANVSLMLKNKDTDNTKKIKELFSLSNNSINLILEEKPKNGNYDIWIEANNWNSEKFLSNKVNLIIN
jgi:membrane carboxypeptidase/penicillin-binding protein PbpC